MEKDRIKEILISMITPENEIKVNNLLKVLEEISDEELSTKLKQMNISESNMKEALTTIIEKTTLQEETTDKFIKVNDWFCYGRTGNTIHMHLIPEDLRKIKEELGDQAFYNLYKEQLEDFLSKMQTIFSEDISIQTLFAVSPIFFNKDISLIHENLGFNQVIEIDQNNNNDNMSIEQKEHFINMFNKGKKNRKVYYTKMSREKLLEMRYTPIKEDNHHFVY